MTIVCRISHTSFLQSNNALCLLVSGENNFYLQPIRNEVAHGDHVFFSNRDEMRKDAFYKMLLYLAKWFWRRFFLIDQLEKMQCLLTNRDKMSNCYRGPSIDDSYQVSVHLGKKLQMRIFLEIDQPETMIAYSGHVC